MRYKRRLWDIVTPPHEIVVDGRRAEPVSPRVRALSNTLQPYRVLPRQALAMHVPVALRPARAPRLALPAILYPRLLRGLHPCDAPLVPVPLPHDLVLKTVPKSLESAAVGANGCRALVPEREQ